MAKALTDDQCAEILARPEWNGTADLGSWNCSRLWAKVLERAVRDIKSQAKPTPANLACRDDAARFFMNGDAIGLLRHLGLTDRSARLCIEGLFAKFEVERPSN